MMLVGPSTGEMRGLTRQGQGECQELHLLGQQGQKEAAAMAVALSLIEGCLPAERYGVSKRARVVD